MIVLRHLISLCLVLSLVATSAAMAVARGQGTASGTMIICTGTGPVSVLTDADGQPVEPVHTCPDCLFSLLDIAAATPDQVVLMARTFPALLMQMPQLPRSQPPFASPNARAPPAV